ncbi:tetratricopeptide repeat protein [Algibacter sp. R77976]|uniref:tetratricopeptide repeat protein n=1 Tax=Algibacter sp. R77976 TaxID=3093873 RepID=UPI0037CBF61F
MKTYLFLLAILFNTFFINAQSTIDDLVKKGIQYHDDQNYEMAIKTYKKALELDPKSTLVNYEISLSYFNSKDYEKAIEYSDNVLKQKSKHMMQAYITKGSSLDVLGKTKESIKLFKKAIKSEGDNYLLHYNLALNYYKLRDLENAEVHVIKAIENNSNHASSHIMLAYINNEKGNTVQTLLALHYFLFLEPDSGRSLEAYMLLKDKFGGNVTKDKDKPNNININISAIGAESDFGAAELMVGMLEASKSLEENKGKTEDEMFMENTDSFFTVLGELKKKKHKGIWWTFYTTFFYELAKSEHIETYCQYISQSGNKDSRAWLQNNEKKLNAFGNWLEKI